MVILVMVMLGVVLRFVQEMRADAAAAKLKAMVSKKVIVKRLNAIQNFGAMNVLCTEKTGTLTQGKIILEKHLNVHGDPSDKVLHFGYLNSFQHTGRKNLLDQAILDHEELPDHLQAGGHAGGAYPARLVNRDDERAGTGRCRHGHQHVCPPGAGAQGAHHPRAAYRAPLILGLVVLGL